MSVDVIEKINLTLSGASSSKRRVALCVLDDLAFASRATVADLARNAKVSQASIVRFCQDLGFTGLPEFRMELAVELSRRQVELEHANIAEGVVNTTDSVADIVSKLAFHEARSIEQTARAVNPDHIDHVARRIASGRRCLAFGVGASALAAEDLAQKLMRIGLDGRFAPDTELQLTLASLATPETVAVGFSFSGRTADVCRCLELAKARGALAVGVTNDTASPLSSIADITLIVSTRESPVRFGALASRIAELAIVDFLFVRVAQLCHPGVSAAIEASKDAVRSHKLS